MKKEYAHSNKGFKVTSLFKFGENVAGFEIPVLNEREIRAAAGLLFLIMFISILVVLLKGNFLMLKYAVTIFLTDLVIRVFVSPKFSPFLIIGRMIVSNQVPEYVGVKKKPNIALVKFATQNQNKIFKKHQVCRCLLFWDLLHTSYLQHFHSTIILVKDRMSCLEIKANHKLNKY
jgi:hypothetical protein